MATNNMSCLQSPYPHKTDKVWQPTTCVAYSHHTPIRLNDAPKVQQSRLQHVTWLGNTTALILVAENDIYVRLSPDGGQDFRLTDSGRPGTIYNGIPDWLYQGAYRIEMNYTQIGTGADPLSQTPKAPSLDVKRPDRFDDPSLWSNADV